MSGKRGEWRTRGGGREGEERRGEERTERRWMHS